MKPGGSLERIRREGAAYMPVGGSIMAKMGWAGGTQATYTGVSVVPPKHGTISYQTSMLHP